MFCPEDGTKIPLIEEIHGQHPMYTCSKCPSIWVYDQHQAPPAYLHFEQREAALFYFQATEDDVVNLLEQAVETVAKRLDRHRSPDEAYPETED